MKTLITLLLFLLVAQPSFSGNIGFSQEDRERLIRIETTLRIFMEQTDKRFLELRENINNRLEQVDKRISELREDMNKRFELMDKRLESMDKRFDQLYTFLWIITGIFTTLTVSVIAFAWWDRRTIIRKAREETVDYMEREGTLKKVVEVLREKAKKDKELAQILKQHGLL
ncbi:hypothetical protein JCM9492_10130 [Aquifex pyrophilus]